MLQSSESNETEVATTTTEATRSNPLHNTFRNYARRHRPSVANEQSDVRALAEEALMRGDEPIRRHSRRNLDLDIVMAELRGENFFVFSLSHLPIVAKQCCCLAVSDCDMLV